MTRYDYLIIGGGIAGVTAAETIREEDPTGSIGIISSESHLLYSRVLLPSYLKKRIKREQVFLRTARDFTKRRIDLYLGKETVSLNTGRKEITAEEDEILGYRKLLISSGGRVNQWHFSNGAELIHRLQTLDNADRLASSLDVIRNPIVVGSSFIALEFIEIFLLNGITPRVLAQEPWFFGRMLDADGGGLLAENFERHGVRLFFGDQITAVEKKEKELAVSARHSGELSADALAIGIGIERNTGFIKDSGVELGEKGGVRTNEFLETSVPSIFVAGDVAEYYDIVTGRQQLVGNWTNAVLQGKRAGLNMAGRREAFVNVPSYAITNLDFQITALGECDNRIEAISRINPETRQYERFFMRGGVLVGAFLINSFKDKPHLTTLINSHTPIDMYRERLNDPQFDIHSIVALK